MSIWRRFENKLDTDKVLEELSNVVDVANEGKCGSRAASHIVLTNNQ